MIGGADNAVARLHAACVIREELYIMAKLQHPNILRCYGGNLEGQTSFIVTELCECSLDKVGLFA